MPAIREGKQVRAEDFSCTLPAEVCLRVAQKMKSVTTSYLEVISHSSTVCSRQLLCFCDNVFLKS